MICSPTVFYVRVSALNNLPWAQTDMCILIRAVLTGFHRSGVIKRLPGKKAINKRAAECFETADVNGNGMVSLDEFEAWAHKHLESQALLLEHGYTRQAAVRTRAPSAASGPGRCGGC